MLLWWVERQGKNDRARCCCVSAARLFPPVHGGLPRGHWRAIPISFCCAGSGTSGWGFSGHWCCGGLRPRRAKTATSPVWRILRQRSLFGVLFFLVGWRSPFPTRFTGWPNYNPCAACTLFMSCFSCLGEDCSRNSVLKISSGGGCCCFFRSARGMVFRAVPTFPATAHIEWPGAASRMTGCRLLIGFATTRPPTPTSRWILSTWNPRRRPARLPRHRRAFHAGRQDQR